MAHSKRNTSLPHFTSYERSLLHTTWGTQKTRLSRDSFLPFASCHLCLLPAQKPVVACATNGDIFCRECAVNNLLAQHKEIKRLEKKRALEEHTQSEEENRLLEEAKAKELRDFELLSMGLEGRKRKKKELDNGDDGPEKNAVGEAVTRKRRKEFKLDEEELRRIFEQEMERAKKELGREKVESAAAQLPSFWVPALTPTTDVTEKKPPKLSPICPASSPNNGHPYSLKTLVTVHFTEEKDDKTGELMRICPSCKKGLGNGSKAILTKPCGHVICKSCVDQFMKPPEDSKLPRGDKADQVRDKILCYVCESDVTERKPSKKDKDKGKERIRPGCIPINCEGTGFAGGGNNIAKKSGTAFQC